MTGSRNSPIVIGLDLGTTNCKAVAVDAAGLQRRAWAPLASSASSYPLHLPHPGQVEQRVQDVWAGVQAALQDLAGLELPGEVAAICLSGAMHSLLPVAADGSPLSPAMTWADQRAAPQAAALRQEADLDGLYARTGCPLAPIYHPAKLRWWLEEAPGLARQAALFIGIKDWIVFRLTGELVTDVSLASTTGLLDIQRRVYDPEALRLAGVTPQRLPPLVASTALAGKLSPEAARLTGLPAGLPVIAGASDGWLANLGAGALDPGEVTITVGTSGAVRRVVSRPLLDPQRQTWCYVLSEGRWIAGGAINNGGLALQWVRERFYPELPSAEGYSQMMADAARVPPGAAGLLLLPYFTGERSPHWDPEARAVLSGLGLEHGRLHIARAALEGVAFCLADVWQVLERVVRAGASTAPTEQGSVRLTGGITASPLWAQIVADVLGVRLHAVEAADASAVGAAMLGHQALGSATLAELAASVPQEAILEPDPARHELYVQRHAEFQALYRKLYAG